MALTVRTFALIVALFCFVVATFFTPPGRFNLTNAGLAFLTVAFLVP